MASLQRALKKYRKYRNAIWSDPELRCLFRVPRSYIIHGDAAPAQRLMYFLQREKGFAKKTSRFRRARISLN